MSAQGRGYTYSFRQILAIIGNGDNTRGRKLLDERHIKVTSLARIAAFEDGHVVFAQD